MTPQEALDLTFIDPDSDDDTPMTIRDYFKLLLSTLWEEGEGFSGKRPFGNSGWQGNLEMPLVQAGCVAGEIYEQDGFTGVDGVDTGEYDAFVQKMIAAL